MFNNNHEVTIEVDGTIHLRDVFIIKSMFNSLPHLLTNLNWKQVNTGKTICGKFLPLSVRVSLLDDIVTDIQDSIDVLFSMLDQLQQMNQLAPELTFTVKTKDAELEKIEFIKMYNNQTITLKR